MRLFSICTKVVAFTLLLLNGFIMSTSAQSGDTFSPTSGPPGTTIVIQCTPGDEQATLWPQPYADADDFSRYDLDGSGRISLTIPANLVAADRYEVYCIRDGSNEFPSSFGTFFITDCPAINNVGIGTTGTSIPRFSLTDLRLNNNGRFVRNVDIRNRSGQVLRLIVRGDDPNEVLNYINTVRVDFDVSIVSQGQISTCNQTGLGPLTTNQHNQIIANQADLSVELMLVQGIPTRATDPLYHVAFTIDPNISADETRTYHIAGVRQAEAKLDNVAGAIQMTMWNRPDTTYIDSLIYRSDRDYPALVSYNRSPINYLIVLEGRDTSNEYTLFGSFTVENDCSINQCSNPSQPTISLLSGGQGLSNGALMNNGEFQVEGYCGNVNGNARSYPVASNTTSDWYCGTSSNPHAYRLGKSDFNQICELTYTNHEIAFVINEHLGNIPAYNWRCYGVPN